MLTVNGTGFVSGSLVTWNGSPRATSFVSGSQLTANILSADIATPATASITVSNPTAGGGTSNTAYFEVTLPTASVNFSSPSQFSQISDVSALFAGDLNGDGIPDLVAGTGPFADPIIILLGKGDGTFQPPIYYVTGENPNAATVGDFNNDGKLDLAVVNQQSNDVSILLGNGDGTFQPAVNYPIAACLATLSRLISTAMEYLT